MVFLIVVGICMDFVVLALLFNMVWQKRIHAHYTYGIHNMNITVLFKFIAHAFAPFWKMEKPKILYEIIILLVV